VSVDRNGFFLAIKRIWNLLDAGLVRELRQLMAPIDLYPGFAVDITFHTAIRKEVQNNVSMLNP
jgi:hypothetical protein